jgi:hypothetical protein
VRTESSMSAGLREQKKKKAQTPAFWPIAHWLGITGRLVEACQRPSRQHQSESAVLTEAPHRPGGPALLTLTRGIYGPAAAAARCSCSEV